MNYYFFVIQNLYLRNGFLVRIRLYKFTQIIIFLLFKIHVKINSYIF
jgi:hypothetical protein